MRIRHYFSHLSINSSASYDVRQGFDKQFVDFIEDCDPNRRCQTTQVTQPPRKPGRPSLGGQTHQTSSPRSASVPALVPENSKVRID